MPADGKIGARNMRFVVQLDDLLHVILDHMLKGELS